MERLEGAGWQVEMIKLTLVDHTESAGISGNGLAPVNGWQMRVRYYGWHWGYIRHVWNPDTGLYDPNMEALRKLLGDDFYALRKVRDGKARKAA